MEVYEFNKNFEKRFEELQLVFDSFVSDEFDKISALGIYGLWVDFAETTIEPTGWTALWCVSSDTCEKLKIKYPTVIYGMVENVFYKELKCNFKIITVEDEDTHLPSLYEVPLDELHPTIVQVNSEVNTPKTANAIDQLRFFYTHLWMPWDSESDDDIKWFRKTLQLRLEYYYDVNSNRIEECLADHRNNLLLEARSIQERREYFEQDLSDTEDNEDGNSTHTTDLMKLHLRMNMIKNEIEMLQNSVMRVAYKEINFNGGDDIKAGTRSNNIYLVLQEGNLTDTISYLKLASKTVNNKKNVITYATLQEVLTKSSNTGIIYIPLGEHKISFNESFKNKGSIKTVVDGDVGESANAVISTAGNERIMMSFDGDFTFENVTFDCRNVKTGILIHSGCVVLKNCKLIDDGKSSIKKGIVAKGQATIKLINCVISNFAIGIMLQSEANALLMGNTIIKNCDVAIEMGDGCKLGLHDSKIANSKSFGINYETMRMDVLNEKKQVFEDFGDSNLKSALIVNTNFKFEKNKNGNIVVRNKRMPAFFVNNTINTNEIGQADNDEPEDPSIILIDDSY